jgi:hypothetical protein
MTKKFMIFIYMNLSQNNMCLLGMKKMYENSGILRRGKSRTINYC